MLGLTTKTVVVGPQVYLHSVVWRGLLCSYGSASNEKVEKRNDDDAL